MSSSVEFYTFEAMDYAIVTSASSEADNHPAEHAIAPLEPNYAWEANEANTQHTITIDLQYPYPVDAIVWMHREAEESPNTGVSIKTIQYSHDGTTWYTASTGPVTPITNKLIKVVDLSPAAVVGQYWKFTFQGQQSPNYYCPTDMRISMLWVATKYSLTAGPAYPLNDEVFIPSEDVSLPFGKKFTIGYSHNHQVLFERRFQVQQTDYNTIMDILEACNGRYRPFVYKETGGDYRLCKFDSDTVDEQVMDIGFYRLTLKLVELPIVERDEAY